MAQNQDFNGFVFLDIETTGLDPQRGEILEIGIVLYDTSLQEIDAENWVIITDEAKAAVRNLLDSDDGGDKYVADMHTKNGLAKEILDSRSLDNDSEHTKRWYMLDIIEWLEDRGATGQPMCGASIGSLDRPFLRHHMPELESAFHYRSIDVSSFRCFTERVRPDLWEQAEQLTKALVKVRGDGGHGEEAAHRALDDARYSALLLDVFWTMVAPST